MRFFTLHLILLFFSCVVARANNFTPIAAISVDESVSRVVYQGGSYTFNISTSQDPDGGALTGFEWRWNSGTGAGTCGSGGLASTADRFVVTFSGATGLPAGVEQQQRTICLRVRDNDTEGAATQKKNQE